MLSDMGMMINRRRACGGKKLPYDYEVEYLENNGDAFIYLNEYVPIISSGNVSVDVDVNLKDESDIWGQVFAYSLDSNSQRIFVLQKGDSSNTIMLRYFCANVYTFYLQLKRHKYHVDKDYLIIDGTKYKHGLSVLNGGYNNNTLFSIWSKTSSVYKAKMALYSFVLSQNGDIILDLIPVVKDNVGYMYDKVSGQLFGNSGTGNFILGNDI